MATAACYNCGQTITYEPGKVSFNYDKSKDEKPDDKPRVLIVVCPKCGAKNKVKG